MNWQTVVTLLIGFLSAAILDWFRDWRAINRERETLRLQRQETRGDRRDESQLETLKALQQTIQDVHLASLDYNRQLRAAGSSILLSGDKVDATSHNLEEAQGRLSTYGVRVIDDEARNLAFAFGHAAMRLLSETTLDKSLEASKESQAAATKANDRLGELIRSL